mgnify:CR=1 FL=1
MLEAAEAVQRGSAEKVLDAVQAAADDAVAQLAAADPAGLAGAVKKPEGLPKKPPTQPVPEEFKGKDTQHTVDYAELSAGVRAALEAAAALLRDGEDGKGSADPYITDEYEVRVGWGRFIRAAAAIAQDHRQGHLALAKIVADILAEVSSISPIKDGPQVLRLEALGDVLSHPPGT